MKAKGPAPSRWVEVSRTESLNNTDNPDFRVPIETSFLFEELQEIKFVLHDTDAEHVLGAPLGEYHTRVGLLVSAPGGELQGHLRAPDGSARACGRIILRAEEVSDVRGNVRLQLRGHSLDKKDWFGKSDPYVVISRRSNAGAVTVIHKTETILKTLNPVWKEIELPVSTFCNGDFDRPVEFRVYDWDKEGGDELIGIFSASLQELLQPSLAPFPLIHPELAARKKKYTDSGTISLQCTLVVDHSFMDFLRAGLRLNFTIAIDYTASNGQPNVADSLCVFFYFIFL